MAFIDDQASKWIGAKSDQIQIRGNYLDETGGVGVSLGVAVGRVVIAGNTVLAGCVSLQGANASTRVLRDNKCW